MASKKITIVAVLLVAFAMPLARAVDSPQKHVRLLCHRTANEDVPENTLESLKQAALLGCDTVEVDVRKTLDGELVLQHDGFLERLSDGMGQVEQTYYEELHMRDAGGWMGDQFKGMRVPRLVDALHFVRERKIGLVLDLKEPGLGPEVIALVRQEGVLDEVRLGGEWEADRRLDPHIDQDQDVWVQPDVSADAVTKYHLQGKSVIANFSTTQQTMDISAMKAVVAIGVDGINVDYPRLGADAVGRPVEQKLLELVAKANQDEGKTRAQAILNLSEYRGFDFANQFARWLLDPDDHVSRAAALALVEARPATPATVFAEALHSEHGDVRANAAWALGELRVQASTVTALLKDGNPQVQKEALVALAHMPGDVPSGDLLRLLRSESPEIRGAAAMALAKHRPELAVHAVLSQLQSEIREMGTLYETWQQRGRTPLSDEEKARIALFYRCQMKEVLALSSLRGEDATHALEQLAFRPGKDFSQMDSVLAGFELWGRIDHDAQVAIQALGNSDDAVADNAEWILIHSGSAILPQVRTSLQSTNSSIRRRAIRVVAWQGDAQSLPMLRAMQYSNSGDQDLSAWAIEKIQTLHKIL